MRNGEMAKCDPSTILLIHRLRGEEIRYIVRNCASVAQDSRGC